MPPPAPETPDLPPWRLVVLWTVLYAAASLCFCAPFLRLGGLDATPDWGDARLIGWTLAWHARWPFTGQWPLDAPFFAPEPQALAYSDPMIALGLMAAPLTAWAGPTVAFNALRLLIPVLNALAMALLVWHGVRDARAAFVAGFAFAFAYSQVAVAYQGIVHLALLAGIPLTARALDRWWHGARVRRPGVGGGPRLRPGARLVVLSGPGGDRHRRPARLAGGGHTRSRAGACCAEGRRWPWPASSPSRALWPLARPFLGTPAAPLARGPELLAHLERLPHAADRHVDRGPAHRARGPTRDARWTDERAYAVGPVAAAAAVAGIAAALVFGVGRGVALGGPPRR